MTLEKLPDDLRLRAVYFYLNLRLRYFFKNWIFLPIVTEFCYFALSNVPFHALTNPLILILICQEFSEAMEEWIFEALRNGNSLQIKNSRSQLRGYNHLEGNTPKLGNSWWKILLTKKNLSKKITPSVFLNVYLVVLRSPILNQSRVKKNSDEALILSKINQPRKPACLEKHTALESFQFLFFFF